MNPVTAAIRGAAGTGPALVAYLTAGFPRRQGFLEQLSAVAAAADVVEIGVPFSDPMADGRTIQRSSRMALAGGATLRWLLAELASAGGGLGAPLLLMSYFNPLLAFGLGALPVAARRAGVAGFIVPDLSLEESTEFSVALARESLSLERASRLCAASRGFAYALTTTGVTGQDVALPEATLAYLSRLRRCSPVPVCAGFGIRHRDQVDRLAPHVDGVIVGSALVEVIERGEDAVRFLDGLRPRRAA
jgi:tryptophan synthase alpha chain